MEFHQLPSAEQAALLGRLAASALREWSLDDAKVELIKYRENAVFAVTAGDQRYVIRVHRPRYRTDDEIRSEVRWMASLDEAGIRTPEVVPTLGGDVLCRGSVPGVPEPRQCDLLRWVRGKPLGTLEQGVAGEDAAVASSYRFVGELAARVHEHGVRWKRPEGFSRPAWDTDALVGDDPTFGRFWQLDCLTAEQRRVLLEARDTTRRRLQEFGRSKEHYGLLHGDLLPENILVADDGPRLIDFDDCGDGWYGFELATGLFPVLLQPNFELACKAYVDGYRGIRSFPDESLALLPTFLMARSLSYLGWPMGRPEMEQERKLAPFYAEAITALATRYLAGEPLEAG